MARLANFVAGVFLVTYSVVRFCVEFFRDPDPRLGYLFGSVTMVRVGER